MLPYPQCNDTKSKKPPHGSSITFPITCNLGRPKHAIAFRHVATPWASVPEATIDKHGYPLRLKIKIWLAGQCVLMHSPAGQPSPDHRKDFDPSVDEFAAPGCARNVAGRVPYRGPWHARPSAVMLPPRPPTTTASVSSPRLRTKRSRSTPNSNFPRWF